MTNSQRLAIVRDYFSQWLASRGVTSIAESVDPTEGAAEDADFASQQGDLGEGKRILSESILIRDGYYCGRKFEAPGFDAVWFMEQDQLKIHVHGGGVAAVFTGDEIGDLSLLPVPVVHESDETEDVPVEREDVVSITTPLESESTSTPNSESDDDVADGDSVKKAA